MNVGKDEGSEAMARQNDSDFIGTLPPRQIVQRAPGAECRKEKRKIILASQFFTGCWNAHQTHQNLMGKKN